MNMPNDFFAKRLAAIEQEKAWRLGAIEEEKTSHAHVNRVSRVIPLVVDCKRGDNFSTRRLYREL